MVEAGLLDDRVPYKESGDYQVERAPLNARCIQRVREVGAVDPEMVVSVAAEMASSKKEDVVAGVYNATKGYTVGDLCSGMNVKPRKFWTAVSKLGLQTGEQRGIDMLKRIVHECDLIENKKSWDVIKTGRKMLEKVYETDVAIQSVNIEKFVKSLVVVATDVCGVCKRSEVMKSLKVSGSTLKKHEIIIQRALSS